MQTLNGMRVKVTPLATALVPQEKWDWSVYRSPSRAKRRRDRSKIVLHEPAAYQLQGELIIHPVLWERLQADARPGGTDVG